MQKLLFRGRKAQHAGHATLAQVGLRDGTKVQMLGSTAQEIDSLNATESEHQRKERILRERALKPQVKVCAYRGHRKKVPLHLVRRSARPVL